MRGGSAVAAAAAALLAVSIAPAHGQDSRGTFRGEVLGSDVFVAQTDDAHFSLLQVFDGWDQGMDHEEFPPGERVTIREDSGEVEFIAGDGCEVTSAVTMNCTAPGAVRVELGDGNNALLTYAFDSQAWVTTWLTRPMTVLAGGGHDQIGGSFGANRLLGGGGRDDLGGGPVDDVIKGGAGEDAIYGAEGDDVLAGGGGPDGIGGGPGNDVINAADGRPDDSVNCHGGQDSVTVDRGDSLRNCEQIERV